MNVNEAAPRSYQNARQPSRDLSRLENGPPETRAQAGLTGSSQTPAVGDRGRQTRRIFVREARDTLPSSAFPHFPGWVLTIFSFAVVEARRGQVAGDSTRPLTVRENWEFSSVVSPGEARKPSLRRRQLEVPNRGKAGL